MIAQRQCAHVVMCRKLYTQGNDYNRICLYKITCTSGTRLVRKQGGRERRKKTDIVMILLYPCTLLLIYYKIIGIRVCALFESYTCTVNPSTRKCNVMYIVVRRKLRRSHGHSIAIESLFTTTIDSRKDIPSVLWTRMTVLGKTKNTRGINIFKNELRILFRERFPPPPQSPGRFALLWLTLCASSYLYYCHYDLKYNWKYLRITRMSHFPLQSDVMVSICVLWLLINHDLISMNIMFKSSLIIWIHFFSFVRRFYNIINMGKV